MFNKEKKVILNLLYKDKDKIIPSSYAHNDVLFKTWIYLL